MNENPEIVLPPEAGGPPPIPVAVPPPLPPPRPWNGWMTLLWMVLLVVVFTGVQTVFFGVVLAATGSLTKTAAIEKLALDGDIVGLVTVVEALVVCPLCILLGKWCRGFTGRSYLALDRPRILPLVGWTAVAIGFGALFNLAAPMAGVDETPQFMRDVVSSTDVLLFLVLGLVVGAPLVEEFIFRGLLLRGWWVARRGRLWAIPLTSILWTALHVQYDLPVLAYIFLLGIVLGYARILSGNLWIPIAMHAANNALATWEVLRLSP